MTFLQMLEHAKMISSPKSRSKRKHWRIYRKINTSSYFLCRPESIVQSGAEWSIPEFLKNFDNIHNI